MNLITAEQFIQSMDPHTDIRLPERVLLVDSPQAIKSWGLKWQREPISWLGMKLLTSPDRSLSLVKGIGLGAPATSMTVELLVAVGARKIIHLGTAASLLGRADPGDVIVVEAAYRGEGVSGHYLPKGDLVSDFGHHTRAWVDIIQKRQLNPRRGPVWTTDALFRETSELVEHYAQRGALAVEMEAAAIMSVAASLKVDLTCFRVVSDSLLKSGWTSHFQEKRVRESRQALLQLLVEEKWP